jgi:hypothetical protein
MRNHRGRISQHFIAPISMRQAVSGADKARLLPRFAVTECAQNAEKYAILHVRYERMSNELSLNRVYNVAAFVRTACPQPSLLTERSCLVISDQSSATST